MLKNQIIIAFLLFIQLISSQNDLVYTNYSWDKNPAYKIEEGNTEPITAIKDKILTEFYFQGNDGLVEYYLEHRVLWLNSDDNIENYNKIYLPYTATSELMVNKARVITKNGTVIELDDSKILTAQDEETGRNYKFFAFEGVEKGSFIEYFYVVRRYPRYSGNLIDFQSSYNKKNIEFDLYAPKNLIFKFKTYNNTPEVVQDTLAKDKLHWQLKLDALKGLEKEELSAYEASKSFVIYKLDRNTASNTKDISSYSKVAQNMYSYYYTEPNSKTQNLLKKFIKEATSGKDLKGDDLIRKLEFFIKTNVFQTEDGSDNFKDLDQILTKKVANESGILKLYISILKSLNIKHELVITSDRLELKFDKDFEANNFLTNFLIYFNDTDAYLSPTENNSRYGFPPAYLTDTYGLFIKEVKVGDFVSGLGKIQYIKPIEADKTVDKMILDIDFEKDNITNTIIKLNRSMSGYYAMYFQPYMNLIKEEEKVKLIEGFAKNINDNVTITSKEIINDDPELFGVKPIEFVLNFNSEAFIEKAGNKYLFKIGELIGKQMQLYQEKTRVLPVENEFTRSYYRTLNVKIPKGYKVANLNDINIKNTFEDAGKELLIFHSYFEQKDDLLVITADEHYRKNIIDTANYEKYRTVINSAADFNKLVLVLEPIQ
ncbi:DUF3857 domain-containing protein [Mariniflexile jejuense]|uniref:DUF3857 domain-containing protein n=1 Tax=Mariniflexile jejuense TaxID=1173582 RepID=A0ABW3JKN3_9FLAO